MREIRQSAKRRARRAVASRTGDALQTWLSTDGQNWTPTEPCASGAVNDSTRGDNKYLVGYQSGLVPLEEFGVHTVWTQTGDETPQPAEITGLRSQGFGYVIGGFRLSDRLEDIVANEEASSPTPAISKLDEFRRVNKTSDSARQS